MTPIDVRVRILVCNECDARFRFVDGHVDPQPGEVVVAVSPEPGEEMGSVCVHQTTCKAVPDLSLLPSKPSTAAEVLAPNS